MSTKQTFLSPKCQLLQLLKCLIHFLSQIILPNNIHYNAILLKYTHTLTFNKQQDIHFCLSKDQSYFIHYYLL